MTRDWTQVSQTSSEHSTYKANEPVCNSKKLELKFNH